MGKAHKLPFPGHFERAAAPGKIVHSDIVGPLEPSYPDQYRYVVTFLDDHSRYLFVGFMCHRNELYEIFESVCAMFESIGGIKISSLHSDGAKEYIRLQKIINKRGMEISFSAPYTPEHNAIAEG